MPSRFSLALLLLLACHGLYAQPLTPTGVSAVATATNQVTVSWDSIAGASAYDIYRSSGPGGYVLIGTSASTQFGDGTVSPNTSYLYRVVARNGGGASAPSIADVATTVLFTDQPLVAGTIVKAAHLAELRTSVNALRATAGLPAAAFSDSPVTAGQLIRAAHIAELRSALNAARTTLGLAAVDYTDPTLTAGVTAVKAAHLAELRVGAKGVGTSNISVAVQPSQVTAYEQQYLSFAASVARTSNPYVTWSVVEGAGGGSITSTGIYRAPATTGTFHVRAASAADPAATATATVVVRAPVISVTIGPSEVSTTPGSAIRFAAIVNETEGQGLTWSVEENGGGSVTAAGVYTAPQQTGTYHVAAASSEFGVRATATVKVKSGGLAIEPFVAWGSDDLNMRQEPRARNLVIVGSGQRVGFGSAVNAVWSIVEPEGGSIALFNSNPYQGPNGKYAVYTAPSTTGTYHVKVAANGDPTATYYTTVVTRNERVLRSIGPLQLPTRRLHTLTRLLDGRVLLAGGGDYVTDTPASASRAEIFDPATNTFRFTGSLPTWLRSHSATLLNDGKVLIAGGWPLANTGGGLMPFAQAQLFDPATGTFRPTGSLVVPRKYHAAVKLKDGKVLIIGGRTGSDDPAITAEVYDPATGEFSIAGNLLHFSQAITGTLLPDGRVFVFMRDAQDSGTTYGEMYDPATGSFTNVDVPASSSSEYSRQWLMRSTYLGGSEVLLRGGDAKVWNTQTGLATSVSAPALQINGESVSVSSGKIMFFGSDSWTTYWYPARMLVQLYDVASGSTNPLWTSDLQSVSIVNNSVVNAFDYQEAVRLDDGRVLMTLAPEYYTWPGASNNVVVQLLSTP